MARRIADHEETQAMWSKQMQEAACEIASRRYPGQGGGEWHALNERMCAVRLMGGEQFVTRAEAAAEITRSRAAREVPA